MLAVSAAMLATSTYAWFTMAKDVSVEGISMTATVPATLQISLGKGTNTTALNTATTDDTTKRLTAVTAPDETNHTVADTDWSNSVQVSTYYTFGKITPATSTSGLDIFYTDDATGTGKTLKGHNIGANSEMNGGTITAVFAQADTADALGAANKAVSIVASEGDDKYPTSGAYYVDIPVWFRTMETDDVKLAVKAKFTAGETSGNLYKAARVSILTGNNTTTATNDVASKTKQGVISVGNETDYYRTASGEKKANADEPYTISEIDGSGVGTWAKVVPITQFSTIDNSTGYVNTGDCVVYVTKSLTAGQFGAGVPYTIRVWLEGEDVNCYNANAGQDFSIDLSFAKIPTT
nr:hypothetical protein [Ruminococcus sp.]